jgi:hypothetical protein
MAVLDLIPPQLLPNKKKKKKTQFAMKPAVVVPRYQPEPAPSQNPVPRRLAAKLVQLGRRYRSVNLTERLAQLVGTAVMLVSLQMALDWLVNLNIFFRALLLAADLALLVHFFRKRVIPLLTRPLNLETSALMVEKHHPNLRGRIIAAVQLSKPSFTRGSPELVQAIQQSTDLQTASMNFGRIVPTKGLRRRIWIALAVTGIWLCLMFLFKPGSIALLERVFLLPAKVPRKTEVICLSGDKTVPAGDSVVLEAQARGIVPSHGRVTLVDDAGHIQEITMDPEKDHSDRFSLRVDRVEQPMEYTIVLGDGSAGPYHVRTVPRPNVTTIDCEQIYPAYTGLPNAKRSVGNLALLAGSQLKIHAQANAKVVKASLKLIGIDKVLPLTIGGAGENELTGQIDIPIQGLTGFSMQLTNEAGITSGDETQYRIDIIPDHAPVIQLTYPERLQELYTLKAKPNIAFVASDDYGLAKVTLCYRFVQDEDLTSSTDDNTTAPPPPPPNRIAMDIGKGHPLTLKNRYVLDLATIKPPVTEGMSIEYWMEAEDANNVNGPGIGASEHHVIKVVSEAEKKAEIMNRALDEFSVIVEIQKHEEVINQNLGTAISGRPEPPPSPAPAPAPK